MANKKKSLEFQSLANQLRAEKYDRYHQPIYKNQLTHFLRRVFVYDLKSKCTIKFDSASIFKDYENATFHINDEFLDKVIDYLTNNGFLVSSKEYNVFEVHLED